MFACVTASVLALSSAIFSGAIDEEERSDPAVCRRAAKKAEGMHCPGKTPKIPVSFFSASDFEDTDGAYTACIIPAA